MLVSGCHIVSYCVFVGENKPAVGVAGTKANIALNTINANHANHANEAVNAAITTNFAVRGVEWAIVVTSGRGAAFGCGGFARGIGSDSGSGVQQVFGGRFANRENPYDSTGTRVSAGGACGCGVRGSHVLRGDCSLGAG